MAEAEIQQTEIHTYLDDLCGAGIARLDGTEQLASFPYSLVEDHREQKFVLQRSEEAAHNALHVAKLYLMFEC